MIYVKARVHADLDELWEHTGAARAIASLVQLADLLTILEDLGPFGRLAIRTQIRRRVR
jgi:hypothetical protein